MKFYLGTQNESWLSSPAFTSVPLFISHRRIRRLKTYKRATTDWALDSGGFTELSQFGRWTIGEEEYIDKILSYIIEIGRMDFAAIQDWMTEPKILKQTGKSLQEHQERTVESFLSLRSKRADIPWAPVLQGYVIDDYITCMEMYQDAGVDLRKEKIVGVGSVCRREGTREIAELLKELSNYSLSLHGFGVKKEGIKKSKNFLSSSDSMAWSMVAARRPILPECEGRHKSCSHCERFALKWYEEIMRVVNGKD